MEEAVGMKFLKEVELIACLGCVIKSNSQSCQNFFFFFPFLFFFSPTPPFSTFRSIPLPPPPRNRSHKRIYRLYICYVYNIFLCYIDSHFLFCCSVYYIFYWILFYSFFFPFYCISFDGRLFFEKNGEAKWRVTTCSYVRTIG